MKPGQTFMFLLVMVAFLVGCGQKGPLYRPAPASDDVTTEQATPSQKPGEHDSGEPAEDH
ncbi:LPS translocon maturation chaperone LptM [Marinobacter algicola]|uniref:LPS translocon maturation chaperone LptM n=1 Tax=Marinobacter algicola TaxID=236100 RepID=UPI003BA96817